MDSINPPPGVNNSISDYNINSSLYYGVYTPNDNKDHNSSAANVFQDKTEALKLAKKNKKSRFKAFHFYHEAAEFALNGSECPNNNTTVDGPLFSKKSNESSQGIGEKGSPFKGPKPQELIELRKAIETGNYKFVRDTIWQNPRYLVSSGDTPSILQEGARHNSLHVAAKAKNAAITELILNTISNVEFIKLLYGDDNQQNAEDRTKILLDLYLNTPNKGLNETPLHFAAKHGAADVVEILVSYPQCDKTTKNKFQKTAAQIICERTTENSPSIRKKIEILLQDSYYVPVLRTEDNSMPPLIGEPFSPTSPPVLNRDPLSPRLEIHAYAGPMDKKGAQHFRKLWKTPPRSLLFNKPNNKLQTDNISSLRFKDHEKGLERIGVELAHRHDVTWKEYWPFLDSFVDITSEEGLHLLETHLASRFNKVSESFAVQNRQRSLPVLHRSAELSPIANLCNALQACRLTDSNRSCENEAEDSNKCELDPLLHIEKACRVFANRISNDILYILCEYDNIAPVLETEIKQLELLVSSYMDDNRFNSVNFQKVHSRLGELIGRKLSKNIEEDARVFLCEKIANLLDSITKSLDCFSSDDEGNYFKETVEQRKPTMYRKQIICLIHFTLSVLTQNFIIKQHCDEDENECDKEWENTEECTCVYHIRKSKKNNSLSRSSSIKNSSKFIMRNDSDNISRRLCFDEDDNSAKLGTNEVGTFNGYNEINNCLNQNHEADESSDEEFYTPPSSPSLIADESCSDDEFNDTELPQYDVYIQGDCPTKTDYTVFNALKHSECLLNDRKHPNIYRWRHNIGLHSESERESWPSPNHVKHNPKYLSPNVSVSTAWSNDSVAHSSTPSKSWLRITGANSPRAVFKSYHVNHV